MSNDAISVAWTRNVEKRVERLERKSGRSGASTLLTSGGTFTPFWIGTVTPGAFTYIYQVGSWWRLEGLLHFWGLIRLSSIDSNPAGDMMIGTNLPAPKPFGSPSFPWPGSFAFQRISFFNLMPNTVQVTLMGWNVSGSLYMFPEQVFDDATFSLIAATDFIAASSPGSMQVIFSGAYVIDGTSAGGGGGGGGGGALDISANPIWAAKGDLLAGLANDSGGIVSVGTNGKVLTADSGASNGVSWQTPSAGSVATDTLWDTKGDLAAATGANAASKLVVGTDGQVLTADSSQATGLKWAAATGADVLQVQVFS